MLTVVRKAKIEDLKYILSLSQKETHSIGFIPKPAYESAITGIKKGKRWSEKCNDNLYICEENDDLVGFMLMSFGINGTVNQICIQKDARLLERGSMLLGEGIKDGCSKGIDIYRCGCADDLESNLFWQAMGWIKIGERKGISHTNTWRESSDRKVNIYKKWTNGLFLPEHFNNINKQYSATA